MCDKLGLYFQHHSLQLCSILRMGTLNLRRTLYFFKLTTRYYFVQSYDIGAVHAKDEMKLIVIFDYFLSSQKLGYI